MRDIDEDDDLRREAIDERRARSTGCKCGNPDWPGSCPGWRNCPVHGEDEQAVCEGCGCASPEEMCTDCEANRAEAAYERHCEDFHDGGATRFNSLLDDQAAARRLK